MEMELDNGRAPTETSRKADHLCVLVHGLWGNPSHLDFIATSLRDRYNEDRLHILVAKRNSGNYTYDGIELGGERLAHEVEETLANLAEEGHNIRKLSFVGYSLGGLVARYALGLLYARGWLDKLEPVNFTTFVSPHVGVRLPLKGTWGFLWNNVGPRTISMSGKQLFMIDTFRDSGRPLLSVLADPDSIFIKALKTFKHRCVYANIVNDRSTIFYTTAISAINPFEDLENVQFDYVAGYEPVIIDATKPVAVVKPERPSFLEQLQRQVISFFTNLPFQALFTAFVIIGVPLFLLNAVVQNFRSQRRIRRHEAAHSRKIFDRYRVPVIVEEVQQVVEEVFESAGARQKPDHLSSATTTTTRAASDTPKRHRGGATTSSSATDLESKLEEDDIEPLLRRSSTASSFGSEKFPTLALTPAQFSIIDSLNSVGFHKFPVWIHNHRHSHAAIIIRVQKRGFDEGKVVVKHWLDQEFEI
ncbi:lipase ROG1 family protein [Aspergillus saccharolyticus JOP 1030-1]|uniref:DUF676-domain-containing protein n=1 Tax=Aspergillus saccharolyticus JOP 1030-1 TaxID=1450539 RepID=A0A318ZDD2_9EURO|nr:DUF676-domain-containing protein [Aspergillus saccharolyticus JOP 1030-1]PYH45511.1 DUF676-domain-containing protein [Aspergillus saccharolyticus JOP 1030-1]